MISIRAYLGKGLQALSDLIKLRVEGSTLPFVRMSLTKLPEAASHLKQFHLARWGRDPKSFSPKKALADLAEILGGLVLMARHGHQAGLVFPRSLTASASGVNEAGIDVMAFAVERLGVEPLSESERLHFLEAKHTLKAKISTPLAALASDIQKTDFERHRNMLQLGISWLEDRGSHPYPERLNKFLEGNAELVLAVLIDPKITPVEKLQESARKRFEGTSTPSGIPVVEVLIEAIPDAELWIAKTL